MDEKGLDRKGSKIDFAAGRKNIIEQPGALSILQAMAKKISGAEKRYFATGGNL